MVKGADGFNYYADTGERVLPNVKAKPPKPEDLNMADKLILPGVGAFDATMQQLIDSGIKKELNNL